jgi:predicted signal transduction protein with EAL and GGDEF domain
MLLGVAVQAAHVFLGFWGCRLGPDRQFRVGLALDDFGTGWSSLAHLRRMPVEELKIDRSFVGTMTEDHDDAVIVRSTIDLARALRLRVMAEGVEDLATWTALNELGCDPIQGFGICRPIPAAEATDWLSPALGRQAFAGLSSPHSPTPCDPPALWRSSLRATARPSGAVT